LTAPLGGEVDAEPAASLIVVNWNGAAGLARCVDSLLADATPTREVFVVDNASDDASPEVLAELERRHPSLRVIRCGENRGYAGGVNAALPLCRGRYVGVFNMDLEAEAGWLEPLVDYLDHNAEVAAVNPLVALADGSGVNAAGQDVHVTGLGFNRALGARREDVGRVPFAISGIQGAAFLVRRNLLEAMGGMDETGFLYHEDVNLSWLLRMMGHELACVPASVLRHDYFLSMHPQKLFLLERNRWALLLTAPRRTTLFMLGPMLLVTEFLLWGYAVLRGPAFVAAKARSIASLWRSRKRLAERRCATEGLRTVGDREVLRALHWRYRWRQFAVLAAERGASDRQPESGPAAS